ncbi:FYN-binding protein 2 isoform X2 [Phascolarctos cinereus]
MPAPIKESLRSLLLSSDRSPWPRVGSIKQFFEMSSLPNNRKPGTSLPPIQKFSEILPSPTDRQPDTLALVQEFSEIPSLASDKKPGTLTPIQESIEIPSTSVGKRPETTLASFKESSDIPSLDNGRSQGTTLTSVKESSESPSSSTDRLSEPRVISFQNSSVIPSVLNDRWPGTTLTSFKDTSNIPLTFIDGRLRPTVSLAKKYLKRSSSTDKRPKTLLTTIKEPPETPCLSSDKGPETALTPFKEFPFSSTDTNPRPTLTPIRKFSEIPSLANDRRMQQTVSSIKVSFNIPRSFSNRRPGLTLTSFNDTSETSLSSTERRLGPMVASIKKSFETGTFASFKELCKIPSLSSSTSQEDTNHRKGGENTPSLPIYEAVDLNELALDPQGISSILPPISGGFMNDLNGSNTETHISGRDIQLPKIRPLPTIETLGCPPPKPPRPPVKHLLALQNMVPLAATTQSIAAAEPNYLTAENQERAESHYEATVPFQKPSENSISPRTDKPPYHVGTEVSAKPRKSFVHQGYSHKHTFRDEKKKGKQPRESELHKRDKELNSKKINREESILRKPQMKEDHRGKWRLVRQKSVSEAKSEEIYEDLYSGDSSQPPMELEEKEKFKKLGWFFKKEKGKLKPKKTKKTLSGFSMSMLNLECKSQDHVLYDDVTVDKKDSKEKEDRVRLWKPKFLMMKENKGTELLRKQKDSSSEARNPTEKSTRQKKKPNYLEEDLSKCLFNMYKNPLDLLILERLV